MESAAAQGESARDPGMSFLLDTDICSAYLKNDPRVVAKVMLHFGGLHVSVITVGELLTWARRARAPRARLHGVSDFLAASTIHEIDYAVADKFGELRADLFDRGITIGEMDLLNASAALVLNLTMVTHNVQDFAAIPGLTLEDWAVG
jgi:tRNA(fMet)-specific endonuclease VapC